MITTICLWGASPEQISVETRWERVGTKGDKGERLLWQWELPFWSPDWILWTEINNLVNKQIFYVESWFLSLNQSAHYAQNNPMK